MIEIYQNQYIDSGEWSYFFMSYAQSIILEELPEGINLIRELTSCGSRNFGLGYFDSLQECGTACLGHSTCQFFVYDADDGECAQELTESIECPEGMASSPYYNFYQVEREETLVNNDSVPGVVLLAES
jgi:hypothetical protein